MQTLSHQGQHRVHSGASHTVSRGSRPASQPQGLGSRQEARTDRGICLVPSWWGHGLPGDDPARSLGPS